MSKSSRNLSPLASAGRIKLEELWAKSGKPTRNRDAIPVPIQEAITRSINGQKTYRYVLPAQILAKVVKPELDCRAIQEGAPVKNAFDARSFCHAVIVPFDRANENVLGGSGEPYASNPLRIPGVFETEIAAQKDKSGFRDLIAVLNYVQEHPRHAESVFMFVLLAIRERLSNAIVQYPTPNRISLARCIRLIEDFLSARTGGTRVQAVAAALFSTIGRRFGQWVQVETEHVNAADRSTGKAADLECKDRDGNTIKAVEVKDRPLTLIQVQDKLPAVRARGIREVFFLVRGGIEPADREELDHLIGREFASGTNLYVHEFDDFLATVLGLLGEDGRRELLLEVGNELDSSKADLPHRQAWRDALAKV